MNAGSRTSQDSLTLTQNQLWDAQHALRGNSGLEASALQNVPNELAEILGGRLDDGSRIIEIGSANGRDARHWAGRYGHKVLALDFSGVELAQLTDLATAQGVDGLITPALFDANKDPLPVDPKTRYDAFYARSALHVPGVRIVYLLSSIHGALREGGLVAIEGKHPDDPKIQRSVQLDPREPELVSDPFENGHVRRVWDPDVSRKLLEAAGLAIESMEIIEDVTIPGEPPLFTRIIASKE